MPQSIMITVVWSFDQASQLYNLGKDAREENDLSSLQPEKLLTLQRLYRDWNLSVQNSNAGGDY